MKLKCLVAGMLAITISSSAVAQSQGSVSWSDAGNALRQLTLSDINREAQKYTSMPLCKQQILSSSLKAYLVTSLPSGVQLVVTTGIRESGINITLPNGTPAACAKTLTTFGTPYGTPVKVNSYHDGYGNPYIQLTSTTRQPKILAPAYFEGSAVRLKTGEFKDRYQVRVEQIDLR